MTLGYLYSKFFKKVVRGKSILNCSIDKTAMVYSGTQFQDSSLGRYSYVGYDCEIVNCEIGCFCSISNGVIIGGAQHPLDRVSTSPVFYNVAGGTGHHLGDLYMPERDRTFIGHDVWIGSRVIIMAGIKIGNGAVIGAGAVVTRDVPPYAIVAGVPAKVLKNRFDDEMIEKMQETKWWEIPDNKLKEYAGHMNKPEDFCNLISEMGGIIFEFSEWNNLERESFVVNHLAERRLAA